MLFFQILVIAMVPCTVLANEGEPETITGIIDLDIDSDNTNDVNYPDRTLAEDQQEQQTPGKTVYINNDDDDLNGIPDKNQDEVITAETGELVPLVLEIGSDPAQSLIPYQLEYDEQTIRLWASPQRGMLSEAISSLTWYEHQTWILGDMNGDGVLNAADNDLFILALDDPDVYWNQYNYAPEYDPDVIGDFNGDRQLTDEDTNLFVQSMTTGEWSYVPLYLWVEGLQDTSSTPIMAGADFDGDQKINTGDNDHVLVSVESPTSLLITAPTSVTEEEWFELTIIDVSTGSPLPSVSVSFNGQTKQTTTLGTTSFIAPTVDQASQYQITAHKETYAMISSVVTIVDKGQLTITAPASIIEEEIFTVLVQLQQDPVSMAEVTFNQQSYTTNTQGKVTIKAPAVEETTTLLITVEKQEYEAVSASIQIIPKTEPVIDGYIFGTVYSSTGATLADVELCATISTSPDQQYCTLTNTDGTYILSLAPGTYTVVAHKNGYEDAIKTVYVETLKAQETSFVLESTMHQQITQASSEQLLQLAINDAIQNHEMGGEIQVTTGQPQIQVYRDSLTIALDQTNEQQLTIQLNDDEDASATLLAVFVQQDVMDLTESEVLYDGQLLSMGSFQDIFSLQSTEPSYAILLTDENGAKGAYLIFHIPEFSEHTITITALLEPLKGNLGIITYVIIAIVVTMLFIGSGELSKRF